MTRKEKFYEWWNDYYSYMFKLIDKMTYHKNNHGGIMSFCKEDIVVVRRISNGDKTKFIYTGNAFVIKETFDKDTDRVGDVLFDGVKTMEDFKLRLSSSWEVIDDKFQEHKRRMLNAL